MLSFFVLIAFFLVSDTAPSEAAYSKMVTIISESNVLEKVQETILCQSLAEGFMSESSSQQLQCMT